jgi:glycerol-3-phosphate acyltransferase PlsY
MLKFLWLIFSYLLGSIPFGFLIAKFSKKVDVLKVGTRQIGGTNVFRNVGKWQGILTGILDLGKGYLAVFLAQKMGFSFSIQAFSGLAAIAGHNWPIFLKFSGGRGIGTFIGALFCLKPSILALISPLWLILALFWDSAAATLIFILLAIFLSIFLKISYLSQFFIGVLILTIIVRIFGKTISPPKNLSKTQILIYRLIFDRPQKERIWPNLITLVKKRKFDKEF